MMFRLLFPVFCKISGHGILKAVKFYEDDPSNIKCNNGVISQLRDSTHLKICVVIVILGGGADPPNIKCNGVISQINRRE